MHSDTKFTHTWEESVIWLRNQPEYLQLVKDAYLDTNPLNAAKRYSDSEEWAEILSILNSLDVKSGDVLDIGGGNGISSYAFARSGFKVSVIEPDPSDSVGCGAINKIKSEEKLDLKIYDVFGEILPFSDNTFDLIYVRQALHHAKNLKKMCGEVFRVLRPGGYFIATREHVISRSEDLQIFLDSHPLHHLYGGENAFTLSTYKNVFKEVGFKIVSVLRPYDSVINYAPMRKNEYKEDCRMITVKVFGNRLGNLIMNQPFYLKWYSLCRSLYCRVPGRLYSFICKKG